VDGSSCCGDSCGAATPGGGASSRAARPLAVVLLGGAAVLLRARSRGLVAADPPLTVIDYHAHTHGRHDGAAVDPRGPRRLARGQGSGRRTSPITTWWFEGRDRRPDSACCPESSGACSTSTVVALGRGGTDRPRGVRARHARACSCALHRQGPIGIASLPEYWRNHWATWTTSWRPGTDGFEIVNCAPKAIGFRRSRAQRVCRSPSRATCWWWRRATQGGAKGDLRLEPQRFESDAHGFRSNRVVARPIARRRASAALDRRLQPSRG